MPKSLAFLPLVSLLLAAACGSSAAPGPSIDQACTDLAQARCNKRMSCTNGTGITRVWGDMSTCAVREKLGCTLGLNAPSTGNSPALVEQCVAALANFSCADFLDGNPPAACIATGPKAANASCAFAGQCASTYCNNAKTSACGTCGAAPAAGTACVSSGCARNQECVPSTMVCQDLGGLGAVCDATTNPCGADLICASSKTCVAAVATAGAPCGGNLPGCDGSMGLYCAGTGASRSCAAVTYAGNGMPCGLLANGSFASCSGGGGCYTATGLATGVQMGTCKAPAADNAPCDITVGPPCLAPARCIVSTGTAGTCTVPTGSTCG